MSKGLNWIQGHIIARRVGNPLLDIYYGALVNGSQAFKRRDGVIVEVKVDRPPRRCRQCQKHFDPSLSDNPLRMFCSVQCASKRHREKERLRKGVLYAREARPLTLQLDKVCVVCGAHFVAGRKDKQVCSQRCADRRSNQAKLKN
jgi:hypothetical protein